MHESISTRISATEKVTITPVIEDFDQHTPVCAINWFDLKRPWFYTLYAALATRYVRKASGKLCFKGTLIKKLQGSDEAQRQNLLIVSYPSARHFLDLVDFRIFQLVSVFRLAAVKDFCFGFTRCQLEKIHAETSRGSGFTRDKTYLVHHFQGDKQWLKTHCKSLFSSVERHQAGVYFCGITSARLGREKSGKQQTVPFSMDGILVIAAQSEVTIERLLETESYREFIQHNEENSLYLFARTH